MEEAEAASAAEEDNAAAPEPKTEVKDNNASEGLPETEAGGEKEPMIAKDTTKAGMEVIEEGEEENGEDEKTKPK